MLQVSLVPFAPLPAIWSMKTCVSWPWRRRTCRSVRSLRFWKMWKHPSWTMCRLKTAPSSSCASCLLCRWKTILATTARPYAFARFGSFCVVLWTADKEIQAKRRLYDQPSSSLDSYAQLSENLIDIQNIMRKNIDEVVHRVEKLDRNWAEVKWDTDVTATSEQLMDDSKKYKWGAKKLNYMVWKKWANQSVDDAPKVCATCFHCGICTDSSLLPFSINSVFVLNWICFFCTYIYICPWNSG